MAKAETFKVLSFTADFAPTDGHVIIEMATDGGDLILHMEPSILLALKAEAERLERELRRKP